MNDYSSLFPTCAAWFEFLPLSVRTPSVRSSSAWIVKTPRCAAVYCCAAIASPPAQRWAFDFLVGRSTL